MHNRLLAYVGVALAIILIGTRARAALQVNLAGVHALRAVQLAEQSPLIGSLCDGSDWCSGNDDIDAWDETLQHAQNALALAPESPGSLRMTGVAKLYRCDFDGAAQAFASSELWQPGNTSLQVWSGLIAFLDGAWDEAIASWYKAGDHLDLLNMCICLTNRQNWEPGLAACGATIRLMDSSGAVNSSAVYAAALRASGVATYHLGGDLGPSLGFLYAALAQDPGNVFTLVAIGDLHYAEGDMENSRFAFQAANEADPTHPLPMVRLGMLAARERRGSDELYWYGEAIEAAPQWEFGYLFLGDALRRRGREDEALSVFEKGRLELGAIVLDDRIPDLARSKR